MKPGPDPASAAPAAENVFVPSAEAETRRSTRRWWILGGLAALLLIAGMGLLVALPLLRPRSTDAVERVAESFLAALAREDHAAAQRVSTLEEFPAIRAAERIARDRGVNRVTRGSFAPLAALHRRIDAEYEFDAGAKRFVPRNALGPAAETLDALQSARGKSALVAKKIESGSPDDLFDAAEQLGKMMANLADTTLTPKRIVPTYQMLVDDARPPLSAEARTLALAVAADPETWDRLLKRPFARLRADGPFILERAEVTALVRDRLASSGDPPSRMRLELVRFRLEGIDTGWKVVAARRELPGEAKPPAPAASPTPSQNPR